MCVCVCARARVCEREREKARQREIAIEIILKRRLQIIYYDNALWVWNKSKVAIYDRIR